MDLIIARPEGLYCPPGDFYIDPWRPVPRAVITHAHGDHARTGSGSYLAAAPGEGLLRSRLGEIDLRTLEYGERLGVNGVTISLHPAGHVLGSAQVRVEHRGEVWVASGDYKTDPDGTCAPFEPVRCDAFITESTFGLPIYRWATQEALVTEINAWWADNAALGRASIVFCYALGKAQRILHGLDTRIGKIFCHGAMEPLNAAYRAAGVALPEAPNATRAEPGDFRTALVLAPPSARGTTWMRRFGEHADAFASGWMQVRGSRRRRGVDRGFVMSDHADWPGLQKAIAATGAERVYVTHGSTAVMQRWLQEQGLDARTFQTAYGDEEDEDGPPPQAVVADDTEPSRDEAVDTDTASAPMDERNTAGSGSSAGDAPERAT